MPPDGAPFRLRTCCETAGVSLARFDHPDGAPLEDAEEPAEGRFQINVVERGGFRLGYEGREWTLGAGGVFLSRPGDVYQYAHLPRVAPDVCLSLAFSDALSDALEDAFRRTALVVPETNRLAFLRLRLESCAAAADPAPLDTLACELLSAAEGAGDARRRLYRPRQLRWYAQRITTARELIDASPAEDHSLWRLASHAAMSPFLFARVFRELVGMPPHRYLIGVRLERAHALLQAGMSVTEACYTTGFNGLSHFIRTFRVRFGHAPSELRKLGRARRRD
jgi:AraC-like DNA-binding protein